MARVKDAAGVIDIYVSNAGVPTTGMGYARFLESTPGLGALRQSSTCTA